MKVEFLRTIRQYNMFSAGDRVIVGVSGGADSMCLLHLLLVCRDELAIDVEVAHINHCIRGAEADSDELFVKAYCDKNNIKLHILRADIPLMAKDTNESIELCARRVRYEFFYSLNADVIATAHTGSDRVETFLMNLSRGSSLNGLCSIPPVRERIVRPLINFTRKEIEEYCRDNKLDFVVDSTNLTDEYTRNKYRHTVVSQLLNINPSFEKNAIRCINAINDDNCYIDRNVEQMYLSNISDDGRLNISNFSEMPANICKRLIVKYVTANSTADIEGKHIDFILENIGKSFSVELPGAIKLSGNEKQIYIERKVSARTIDPIDICKGTDRLLSVADKTVNIVFSDIFDKNDCVAIDADKVSDVFTLRSRQAGDTFNLGRRKCSKTLKKLFNEMKIPSHLRESVIVLADEQGLIYVEGIGVDSHRCVDLNTKKYILIKMEENSNG